MRVRVRVRVRGVVGVVGVVEVRVVWVRVRVVRVRIWVGALVLLSPGLAVLARAVSTLTLPCRGNGVFHDKLLPCDGEGDPGGGMSIVLTWWRGEFGRR